MDFGRVRQYRFLPVTVFAFWLTRPLSAQTTPSSPLVPIASIIWMIAAAALGLLAVYSIFLLGSFFLKTIREALAARKEAPHHPSAHPEGNIVTSALPWVLGLFAVFITGVFFVVLLLILSHMDLSSTRTVGSLIVMLGAALFGLLVFYTLGVALAAVVKWLRKAKHKEAEHGAGAATGEIPLNPELTRRSFLSLLGWAWVAFTAATMGAVSTMLRFAFPNVTFEPPLKFAAGFPDTYSPGVDERFKESHRCWIVRNTEGFYALSTICTHLGCTPNWLQAEQKFKCPCHGSGYYITGVNFEGPAPRPLPRYNITLADDGQIQIDEGTQYQQELGQWGLPGSFLYFKG
jgi:cytochrome b6-f complex iron-sulfur subunit